MSQFPRVILQADPQLILGVSEPGVLTSKPVLHGSPAEGFFLPLTAWRLAETVCMLADYFILD